MAPRRKKARPGQGRKWTGSSVPGLTLDSGALIAVERGDELVRDFLREAILRGRPVTVPSIVLAEVWRGGARSARIGQVVSGCKIEEVLSKELAYAAGEALAAVGHDDPVDAVVMASAAGRGDSVLTSDPGDLGTLETAFKGVKLLAV